MNCLRLQPLLEISDYSVNIDNFCFKLTKTEKPQYFSHFATSTTLKVSNQLVLGLGKRTAMKKNENSV